MFEFLSWLYIITFFLCLLSYFVYPIVIWGIGKLFPFKLSKENIEPTISIIIPAYNEEKNIEQKIKNTLSLNYPKEKTEILVASDGSTDKTGDILRKFSRDGVKIVENAVNQGKTTVQNDLVSRSKGDILIFTDAASFLEQDAMLKLIQNFSNNQVGCVAGRMHYTNTEANITTQSQGLYWRYESKIRDLESKIGHLIGVDGPLYAIRRDCYIPLSKNIISDFITPLLVSKQKKKVVLEPNAVVYEDPTRKSSQELATRRRIVLRCLVSLLAHMDLLNPFKDPILAIQILLHKVLRWFVGILVIINCLACVGLSGHWFFEKVLIVYLLFFVGAVLGWIGAHLGIKNKILMVPYYFVLVNMGATLGIIDFFRKKQTISWKPVRE